MRGGLTFRPQWLLSEARHFAVKILQMRAEARAGKFKGNIGQAGNEMYNIDANINRREEVNPFLRAATINLGRLNLWFKSKLISILAGMAASKLTCGGHDSPPPPSVITVALIAFKVCWYGISPLISLTMKWKPPSWNAGKIFPTGCYFAESCRRCWCCNVFGPMKQRSRARAKRRRLQKVDIKLDLLFVVGHAAETAHCVRVRPKE